MCSEGAAPAGGYGAPHIYELPDQPPPLDSRQIQRLPRVTAKQLLARPLARRRHLQDCDTASPVCSAYFDASGPPSLQPARLQRSVAHHPWVDGLPFLAMHDYMIQSYGAWAEEDGLCGDTMGRCSTPGRGTGLIVCGVLGSCGLGGDGGFLEELGLGVARVLGIGAVD